MRSKDSKSAKERREGRAVEGEGEERVGRSGRREGDRYGFKRGWRRTTDRLKSKKSGRGRRGGRSRRPRPLQEERKEVRADLNFKSQNSQWMGSSHKREREP